MPSNNSAAAGTRRRDEVSILTGYTGDEARALTRRLIDPDAIRAGLFSVSLSTDEVGVLRAALLNLAYGPPTHPPPDLTHTDVVDMYEDLKARWW